MNIGQLGLPLCPRCGDTKYVDEFRGSIPDHLKWIVAQRYYCCNKCQIYWKPIWHLMTIQQIADHEAWTTVFNLANEKPKSRWFAILRMLWPFNGR